MVQSTESETPRISAVPLADTPVAPTVGRFADRTPWSGAAAGVFALAVIAVASGAAILTSTVYFEFLKSTGGADTGMAPQRVTLAGTMLTMAAMQIVLALLIWWASGWFGGARTVVLSLRRRLDRRTLLVGIAGMIIILGPYNLAVYLIAPSQFANDLKTFSELARSDAALIALLVVTIGAPISEELMFRGFLLPAVAKARTGIIGAGIITSLAWTLLHVGYSLIGLFEVFVIGLYFAWLMWKFESLKLVILLHALYNGLQMAILMALPSIAGQ